MKDLSRYIPYGAAGFVALCLVYVAIPRGDAADSMHLQEWGQLPVASGGRVQPLDTYARNTLMLISNRATYKDENDEMQPAIKWLLAVMTSDSRLFKERASNARDLRVFRIENDQILDLLELKIRPKFFRYSFNEIARKGAKLMPQIDKASRKDVRKRDVFDVKLLHLARQLEIYEKIAGWKAPFVVPPDQSGGDWMALLQTFVEGRQSKEGRAFAQMLITYSERKVDKFNTELADYQKLLAQDLPADVGKTSFETFFNGFAPFYWCAIIYVLVFLCVCVGWVAAPQTMNRTAFWMAVVALTVHTWALVARMYLSGRPMVFVTNLYSSAVFIGWMCVVLGVVLERIYQNGMGNLIAGVTGSLSLIIAHHPALGDGDTLEMLQAVLDTNFWLATHVTTVTIGYAATLFAGFLGIGYIFAGLFGREVSQSTFKTMAQMIYGIICFAMLFSFVGTVLGGIWADQSWGRFWGWDPKENGALLIVLWNALILHARWGGIIKQRGMAVLAVAGNMVTFWSWFGTNQLGVGLHAYGFSNALALICFGWWMLHLLIIVLGLLPQRWWLAFAPKGPIPAFAGPGPLPKAKGAPPSPRRDSGSTDITAK